MINRIDKNKIIELLDRYNLPHRIERSKLSDTEKMFLREDWFIHYLRHFSSIKIPQESDLKQAAGLLLMLESCNKEIKMQGTITFPSIGEMKGSKLKYNLTSPTLIEEIKQRLYEFISDYIKEYMPKIHLSSGDILAPKEPFIEPYFGTSINLPYSREELKAIIKHEDKVSAPFRMSRTQQIGQKLNALIERLNSYNYFEGLNKTEIYSFLYDLNSLRGFDNVYYFGIRSGDIGHDKFRKIDYYLKKFKETKNV